MSKINVLIVEDKLLHYEKLEFLLSEMGYAIAGHAESGEEALRLIKAVSPDVILMDIQIAGGTTGIDLAEKLKGEKIPIIFTTSFKDSETLERAIATGPNAYLTKPINKVELQAAISLAMFKTKEIGSNEDEVVITESIFVKQGDMIIKITFDEMLWVVSGEEEKYIHLKLAEDKLKVRSSLKKMMEKLPAYFVRINSSTAINLKRIDKIQDSHNLIMVGEFELPLSRRFKKEFMEKLSFLN